MRPLKMQWNNVEEFMGWWLETRIIRPPFKDTMFTTDFAQSFCLYREGRFQVELYLLKENITTPFHRHPNVDSMFLYLGGNLEFGLPDKTFTNTQEFQKEGEHGAHMLLGKIAVAMDGELHSVRTYDQGGAFLSFEYWQDKNPSSVVVNWDGEYDGPVHIKTVTANEKL